MSRLQKSNFLGGLSQEHCQNWENVFPCTEYKGILRDSFVLSTREPWKSRIPLYWVWFLTFWFPCTNFWFPCTIFSINKMMIEEIYLQYVHMIMFIVVKWVKIHYIRIMGLFWQASSMSDTKGSVSSCFFKCFLSAALLL